MKKLFSLENTLHNFNLFKLKVNGVNPVGFIEDVLRDPFKSKTDSMLQLRFEYMKKYKQMLNLTPAERVVVSLILQKGTYEKAISELPHMLYLASLYKTRVYPFPEIKALHPKDQKSGDFFIPEHPEIFFECKSSERLGDLIFLDIIKQYSSSRSSNKYVVNILYKTLEHSNSIDFGVQSLKNAGFQVEPFNLITSQNLEYLLDRVSLYRVLSYYNNSWSSFSKEYYSFLEKRVITIRDSTTERRLGCNSYLKQIEEERSGLLVNVATRKKRRLYPIHILPKVLPDQTEVKEEPEDLFSDFSDNFTEDSGKW